MAWEENGKFYLPLYHERPDIRHRPKPPHVRADCLDGGVNEGRPCPWIGCRYNLPEAKAEQHSCALDIADQGGITLEEIGELLGVTRERVRQIEAIAIQRIRSRDLNFFQSMLRKSRQN